MQLPSHTLFIHFHLHATDSGCHLSELQCRTAYTFTSGPHCVVPAGPCSLFLTVSPPLRPFLLMNYKALVVPPTCNDVSNSRPSVILLVLYLNVYAV